MTEAEAKAQAQVFMMKMRAGALSETEIMQAREVAAFQILMEPKYWVDETEDRRQQFAKNLNYLVRAQGMIMCLDSFMQTAEHFKIDPSPDDASILLGLLELSRDAFEKSNAHIVAEARALSKKEPTL